MPAPIKWPAARFEPGNIQFDILIFANLTAGDFTIS